MAIIALSVRALLIFIRVTWVRIGLYSDRISTLVDQLENDELRGVTPTIAIDTSLSLHSEKRQTTLKSLSQLSIDTVAAVRESLGLARSTRLYVRLA